MKATRKHIALQSIRIFLMIFWLYVALDKLWDLQAFHRALQKQPFPKWWADALYWSLPLFELGIALLFVFASSRGKDDRRDLLNKQRLLPHVARRTDVVFNPYHLSALLLLIFSIYIGLGVAGFYSKRPCGCASVFNGLSWDWHLLVNIGLLALSLLGWWFAITGPRPSPPGASDGNPKENSAVLRSGGNISLLSRLHSDKVFIYVFHNIKFKMLFPRKFAPFPGTPVSVDLN